MNKIFISYSHQDKRFIDALRKQLKVLELENLCDIWDDSRLKVGSDWLKEIQQALETATIAILLISADFLISPFIRTKEVPPILERREKEGLRVLPLIIRPCLWQKVSWLNPIDAFPVENRSLSKLPVPERENQLTQFTQKVFDLLQENAKTPPIPIVGKNGLLSSLPPRLIQFIGRSEELTALESRFKSYNRVVLLNGVGGIGKTEVCKAFFIDHYEQYDYAAWVDWAGTVRDSLVKTLAGPATSFIEVTEKDTLDDRFEKLILRLSHEHKPFLLVLDNIENSQDKDLVTLTRLPRNIKILVSSRANIEGFEMMPLDVLSERECMDLFYGFYHGTKDDLSLKELIGLCGCHTLTVELAARTADKGAKPIAWLLEQLKHKGFNLNPVLGETFSILKHGETGTQTFFEHLLTLFDLSGLTRAEKIVLARLSLLPSVYIPMAWVKEWLVLDNLDGINGLVKRGWLRKGDGFLVYMHPVIQEVVFQVLKPTAKTCRVLIISLAKNLSTNPGDNPLDKQVFVPYAERLVLRLAAEDKDEKLAILANNLSATYLAMSQLERALAFQLKAVTIAEKVLGENHPHLATSYNNVSLIYLAMGQLESALEFQLKALTIREKVLEENHPDLATSYNNVSMIYKNMGQLESALEFQLKALTIQEKVLGENHPELAQSYNNVAQIYKAMGQLESALAFQLKDIKILEKVLGENHPSLATSYNNVAQIYKAMGQLESALEFQLKAVTICEKVLGENHPDFAQSYHNLSTLYLAMQKYTDALTYSEKAVFILQKLFPNGHPNRTTAEKNLAVIKENHKKHGLK